MKKSSGETKLCLAFLVHTSFCGRISDTDEDFDDDALSPTKFKDLCSKKVSPTKSKMLLLTPEKILNLQDLSLSPVKEVSEIETKETSTSPYSDKSETIKPNQLISTRKGFRSRKRLSPIHGTQKFEPKAPVRVDKGLSPIAVFTAGPSGVDQEESEYFVQTYDAPTMEAPEPQSDKFSNKSTEMSPNTIFEAKYSRESSTYLQKLEEINKLKQQTEQDRTLVKEMPSAIVDVDKESERLSPEKEDIFSDTSCGKVEKSLTENLLKVEKSTSPFSDLMLDTGIGTDSPVTADTASSPFLLDVQSPSSLTFQSSSALLLKENCSTQTIQVEMLSAHTSPIDGPFSLQDSNLSFCPTESSLKSDSLDDLSKTLGTPSSDVVEPVAVLEFAHSQEETPKPSVKEFLQEHVANDPTSLADDLSSSSQEQCTKQTFKVNDNVTLNKMMVIESFRNVFATEPPFAIVAPKKGLKTDMDKKKKRKFGVTSEVFAEDRLFTLHDQLLSEESALESSTDSGVDLKETSQSYPTLSDHIGDSSSKDSAKDRIISQFATGSYDIEQYEDKTPLSEQHDILPEDDLSEIEKQIIPAFSEYSELETDSIYVQDVLEPSIEQTLQKTELQFKKSEDSESNIAEVNIIVVEEVFVKTTAYSYTGDKAVEIHETEKDYKSAPYALKEDKSISNNVISDAIVSKHGGNIYKSSLKDVEEQILSSTASQRFVSPIEIDRTFAQQIFPNPVVEENVIDSTTNSELEESDALKPVTEKTIVPKEASLDYYDSSEYTGEVDPCPKTRANIKPLIFSETDVKFSVENQFSNKDETTCRSSKTFSDLSGIADNKILVSDRLVTKHERRSLSHMEETSFDSNWEQSNSADIVFKGKLKF